MHRPLTRIGRALVPALLALGVAMPLANAQSAEPMKREHRPSAETMQRMEDGRFAMIKGALKMTDAQAKLWQPVEDVIRARHAQRRQSWQNRSASADQGGAASNGTNRDKDGARPSFAERLERDSKLMTERAEQTKAFAAAFRPFSDSLTEEQKTVVEPLLARLTGEHRAHGGRWASHEGRGDRRGDHRGDTKQE